MDFQESDPIIYASCDKDGKFENMYRINPPFSRKLEEMWMSNLPEAKEDNIHEMMYIELMSTLASTNEDIDREGLFQEEKPLSKTYTYVDPDTDKTVTFELTTNHIYYLFFGSAEKVTKDISFLGLTILGIVPRDEIVAGLTMHGDYGLIGELISRMDMTHLDKYIKHEDKSCREFAVFAYECLCAIKNKKQICFFEIPDDDEPEEFPNEDVLEDWMSDYSDEEEKK